jgi:putative hydrolase of the HAD superfamily
MEIAQAVFGSPTWEQLDEGALSAEEAKNKIFADNPQNQQEIELLFSQFEEYLEPLSENYQLVKNCKARGIKLYLLSNISDPVWQLVIHRDAMLKEFDGHVLSYVEKVSKPHPPIYQILLDRYCLVAEECLYIDDRPENIAMGLEMGLIGEVLPANTSIYPILEKYQLGV